LAVATLLALAPFGASAAATATLSQRTLSLPLGRLLLLVPVTGDLRYRLRDGRAEIDGRLTADLAEVRERAPAVLSALLDHRQPCGDRVTVRDGQLGAREAALSVVATIDYGGTACIAGQEIKILPRARYDVELLLHPVVSARSLRMRSEVLRLVRRDGDLPPVVDAPLRLMLAQIVDERIGELFPAGAVPPELALKSLSLAETEPGGLVAHVEAAGTMPQVALDRLLERR
jgi:hypothetical protein